MKIVADTFPLRLPNVKHTVINSYASNELRKRFNEDSVIVPNVMDFNKPYAERDDYNDDLLEHLGFIKGEIGIFQITRIVKRKGIETAIDLIHRLEYKKIKLIVTGSTADDERKGYFKNFVSKVNRLKLDKQIHFGHKSFLSERESSYSGRKIYSLSNAYANATACTYFSTYEGFGNAFVECVLAKKPIFVNNYQPVYWPDIGSKGFKTVMIENSKITDKTVIAVHEILLNQKLQKEIVEHNYELGKKHFGSWGQLCDAT